MIVRKRPGAFALFFVVQGSVIKAILPQVIAVALVSLMIVVAHRDAPQIVPSVNSASFALIGIALSVFLSFRNSACYDRWWEARKLWGMIIQTARDILRQTAILGTDDARRQIVLDVVTFAHRSERQLRGAPEPVGADTALIDAERRVAECERAGTLTRVDSLVLRESILRLSQALTACERLANTPLPFAYTLLLHRTAYIFCFILPFGFADTLGWLAPIGTALVAYTFFGLDALAEEMESPFGASANALPLSAYATMVEITLRGGLGDTDLPPTPLPVRNLLT